MLLLSILIPAYEMAPTGLVLDLLAAADLVDGEVEIIVADDGSPVPVELGVSDERVRLWRSEVNLGRARVRNRLADLSKGELLWFVDSDARVGDVFSLSRYVEAMREGDVVCGGVAVPAECPSEKVTLRYRYERSVYGRQTAEVRNRHPYDQLGTFNLVVWRDVFMQVRFDEELREYGFEDTLFGAELEQRGKKVVHVDNPLVHMGLEPNAEFLSKTETALRTLHGLGPRMLRQSRLMQTAERLRRWHGDVLVRWCYRLSRPLLRRNLTGRKPSLTVFSLYKLGYYLSL